MTNVLKKLVKDGVEYEIQGTTADATSSTKGLVKLGSDTTQTTAANNPSSTTNRTYPIQTNSSGQMVVNVPWEDSQTGSATTSVAGTLKLGSDTQQSVAANTASSTASRTYPLQLNGSGQGVINVPWTDHTYAASDFDIKDLSDSTSLRTTWSGKQDKIVAGTNISIANDGKTISATDTTYSASDFDIKDLSDSTSLRTTWSGKQDALDTQTAYTSKGTASKVPQITTNTLGQVTGITEVNISYPSQVSDTAYASSWNGVTGTAPSKNAVYDKISAMDTTISGKADSSSLGTAATKNTGTSSGNVPVLDSNGKLDASILPSIAITDTFTVTNASGLTGLTDAKKGDIGIVTSESKTYILSDDPYSTAANWKELATPTDAVTSVNGQTGAVTLSIPTVYDATLTITQNGTSAGTFTANASSNKTIALTDTTYESKEAASAGTAVSLVTTGEKYTWNNKQNALTTQTAYSAKGTTTKVPQITTNTLGQVTTITEKSIAFPVTSVNGGTGAVTGLQTTANLKTSLTDNSDSYYPSQKAVKTAVDGKQDTLSTQTAYTSKGTSTKVATITTNTLGQVTAVSETSIAFPVTSVNGNTGAVTGLQTQHSVATASLTTAGWSSNTQTVNVTGVTASNTVIVSPAPSSIDDYAGAGIYCSAQASGSLTFTCDTTPSSAITVNVLILN